MSKALAKMVEQVWKEKDMPKGFINNAVTTAFAKKLWAGVTEGYGKDIVTVDYDTPDYNMLAALQDNVWQFSAAKNYAQLRELGAALIDENGTLRSFEQFKEVAFKINDRHVNHWLKAEYNLAVGGGQMSGKWVDIQRNADTLPLLEFDTVLDGQTTSLCRSLHGTRLPITHPFWRIYYPLNHYGCRSTVRQVANGKVTPEDRIPSADIPSMFRTNLAEQGLVFPKDHAYFVGIPNSVLQKALTIKK